MRRLLVVAYYFPPMGLSGVQRVAKFVRYLSRYGWQPTVLTVEPGGYYAFDRSLLAEVEAAGVEIVRAASTDPTRIFGKGTRVTPPTERTRQRLSWLSQTVLIPDNKIGWYPRAVRAAKRLETEHRFDAVLASAPPYTGHLVGATLAKRWGVPLVTDFRDDWLDNPRHVYPTRLHRAAHAALERRVIAQSDLITTINPVIADAIRSRHPDHARRVTVLEQGFDPEDYPGDSLSTESSAGLGTSPDAPFRLVYTGVFYDAQTPATFLEGLAIFRRRMPRARVRADFFGLFPDGERDRITRLGLDDVVTLGGYLEHREAMSRVVEADVAWLTVGRREGAEQISTGKLYAYVGARKPILALVPAGAAREALLAYGAAEFADPDDPDAVADAIGRLFDAWSRGALPAGDPAFVRAHDRTVLTRRLANLLDGVVRG